MYKFTHSRVARDGSVRRLTQGGVALRVLVGLAALLVAGPAAAVSTATFWDYKFADDLGYVGPSRPVLEYSHVFDPAHVVTGVDSVHLGILLTDDLSCSTIKGCFADLLFTPDIADVDVNGANWFQGQAHLLWGDITLLADVESNGDTVDVRITTKENTDLLVVLSKLKVEYLYEGPRSLPDHGSSAIPEPSAALAFATGLLVVSGRLRRR